MTHMTIHRKKLAAVLAAIGLALLAGGCSSVPVHKQRLVAKRNMQFSASPAFDYSSRVLGQIESGSAITAGGQSAGCTSCR